MSAVEKNPDFYTALEAAEVLNISRQYVHQLIHSGGFSGVTYVGYEGKPIYLLRKTDVEARRRASAEKQLAAVVLAESQAETLS